MINFIFSIKWKKYPENDIFYSWDITSDDDENLYNSKNRTKKHLNAVQNLCLIDLSSLPDYGITVSCEVQSPNHTEQIQKQYKDSQEESDYYPQNYISINYFEIHFDRNNTTQNSPEIPKVRILRFLFDLDLNFFYYL